MELILGCQSASMVEGVNSEGELVLMLSECSLSLE
jgi:hypothetical protein